MGCSALSHGGPWSWVLHPSGNAVTCCGAAAVEHCPGPEHGSSSAVRTVAAGLPGRLLGSQMPLPDWHGAGLLLQPPRRHWGLLVSPRGPWLKGSSCGGLLRRLLRLPALRALGPAERVQRH